MKQLLDSVGERLRQRLSRIQTDRDSAAYQTWRQQFLLARLKIALWIAFPAAIALALNGLFVVFLDSQRFESDILRIFEDASLIPRMRSQTLVNIGIQISVLLTCVGLWQSRWGKQHPTAIFLLLSSILTWLDLVVATIFGIPTPPDPRFFLAQAVLIPVHWRLHLISQLVPIAHYAIVYPLFGLTKIGKVEFYSSYSVNRAIELIWIGIISISSIYLYERLKRSELESQRQLRSVIHAISHDLKTPVMGMSVILQGLLQTPDSQLTLDRQVLEQLLAGSERQINLIESLLAAQSAETGGIDLQLQPLQVATLVDEIIADLDPIVRQHRMILSKDLPANLPLVNADKTQLWRVFNNLIDNALKHNPGGTHIEISIEAIDNKQQQWLRCNVRDNGIGIPQERIPHLFKLYSRGTKAKRMPGLGLGLYLCQQIIIGHQGKIGVTSQVDRGSNFWFTLPIDRSN